eukprot:TRINITY_DN27154_c1_g1_i1.p1 TRINITY_DN27154_c1_g1~~TRINITY_DN27154_c1_g1_i1.p1  ORF type:complete len:555 (-),score=68.91 TRINITY_DN27154_c1_g1_i1:269-1873(-)
MGSSSDSGSSIVDPFELMGGMVTEVECEPVKGRTDPTLSRDDPICTISAKPEMVDPSEVKYTADQDISTVTCFEFWEKDCSGATLVEGLSRHLTQLRSHGFKLPWSCTICGSVNASWFGACEECKSCNDAFESSSKAWKPVAEKDANESLDHVVLELARRLGPPEVEACFLMCEAMAVAPERGISLYRRSFKLWPQLDTNVDPDGVPNALREEADAILASRSSLNKDECGGSASGIFPLGFWSPHWIGSASKVEAEPPRQRQNDCEVASKVVVVYSYHQEDGGSLGSWFLQAQRSASQVRTLHADHLPPFELWVICNVDTKAADKASVFDQHVVLNLAKEAGFQQGGRVLCGTKIQTIIYCLEQGYDKVVFMDSDTHVLRPFLSPMLAALEFYDITGVFEGPPVGMAQTRLDPLLEDPHNEALGFELNTGVLGVRASALELCKAWLVEFRTHCKKYASVSSADQPALMQVLRHRTERVFPLPPTMNFRPYTVFSPSGPSMPSVIHDHDPDSDKAHADVVGAVCSHLQYGLRWKP